MRKVTGLGGIFFTSKDPEAMKKWYSEHLGIVSDKYGTSFEWRQEEDPSQKGQTAWNIMEESSSYMEPSFKPFMINYRVDNIEGLVEKLKLDGVTILDQIETFDYGKFVHIMDPEGNKIELWEAKDEAYSAMDNSVTK